MSSGPASESGRPITVIATGELMLCMRDDPEPYFEPTSGHMRAADAVIGHLEFMHTRNPEPAWYTRMAAPDPDKLRGLLTGHFSAVTLAGNPAYEFGPPGIRDTISWLDEHGIAHAGAGMSIDEAVEPAVLERGGTTIGLLAYNCVGPAANAATAEKPGTAYVDVITHFEPGFLTGSPAQTFTWPEPWSLEAMREEIRALRACCDVVMVSLHMGLVHFGPLHNEVHLADYEPAIARAAIEAGADVVLGNHAHVLKGVEFYRGKPIFYCLGNYVTAFPWTDHYVFRPRGPLTTRMRSKLREQPGSAADDVDPAYPNYPMPEASRNAMLAKIEISGGALGRLSFIPCLVDPQGRPIPVTRANGGQDVLDYMEFVTQGASLNASYAWDGDEVVITPA